MDMLVWVAIGVLVLAILFMLIPVISAVSSFQSRNFRLAQGGQFEANMPALGATSNKCKLEKIKPLLGKRVHSEEIGTQAIIHGLPPVQHSGQVSPRSSSSQRLSLLPSSSSTSSGAVKVAAM